MDVLSVVINSSFPCQKDCKRYAVPIPSGDAGLPRHLLKAPNILINRVKVRSLYTFLREL